MLDVFCLNSYPLVNVYIVIERSTISNGKTHKILTRPFSITMKQSLPEGMENAQTWAVDEDSVDGSKILKDLPNDLIIPCCSIGSNLNLHQVEIHHDHPPGSNHEKYGFHW